MNANGSYLQIFHLNKYDLKGHGRSQKFNNQVFVQNFGHTFPFFIYESILIILQRINCKMYLKSEQNIALLTLVNLVKK